MIRLLAGLVALAIALSPPMAFGQSDRAREAADLILKLCIADSTQTEVVQDKNSVHVSGEPGSVTIKRNEVVGLAGGITSSLNQLSSQQASEARACTQRYLKKIVDALLGDEARVEAPAQPSTGDIHITRYPGNPQCTVSYAIFMNNFQIVPYSDDWLVQGIRLGKARWIIKGQVNCNNYDGYCVSSADNQTGEVDLQNGGRYFFNWQIIPGSMRGSECQFTLYKQS
jgi:hypothetical protein